MHMKLSVISKRLCGMLLLGSGLSAVQGADSVDFAKDIQPTLEWTCLPCHNSKELKGQMSLETRASALKGGKMGPVLVPGKPEDSLIYIATTRDPNDEKRMPPKDKYQPLPKLRTDQLREWIRQGASWPDNLVLKPRVAETVKLVDEGELVAAITKLFKETPAVASEAEMRPYTNTIPDTTVRYTMIPIHSGEFRMGSPEGEAGRKPDEGPTHQVKINAFWMGRCEVTWNEFELFMYPSAELKKQIAEGIKLNGTNSADAVARPSAPYVDLSFGMGKGSTPAISMTQHAANKYCEWLSAKTGHFYRLPTEAEWEYACRAGTTTAYSFGDDPAKLGDYAWFVDNSSSATHPVATKKANPWGLHDMHGNVWEWCQDLRPWHENYVQRGGSWSDDPTLCRAAYRFSHNLGNRFFNVGFRVCCEAPIE